MSRGYWLIVSGVMIGTLPTLPCCTTTTPPIAITGHSIAAAGTTFEATAAVLDSLYRTGAVTEAQYAPWRGFSARWQAGYHAARLAYDAAAAKGDVAAQQMAASVLDNLLSELTTYQALIAQAMKPIAPAAAKPTIMPYGGVPP